MKKHLLKRILILFILIFLFAVIFVELYVTKVARANTIDDLKKSLLIQTKLITDNLLLLSTGNPDTFCLRIKGNTGSRVTLMDKSGRVLCDSDRNPSLMDNHINRPEIRQALSEYEGSSIRYSKTIGHDFLYVARKIVKDSQPTGFIRLAVPLVEVNRTINALRLELNLVLIMILIVSGIIIVWQTEKIRKFVNQITEYSGAIARGLLKKRLYLGDAGEFTELAYNLNYMAGELESSLKTKDEETNRLKVILRSIPDALLLININGIIELSNNAARSLFGSDQLEGKPFIEVVRSADFSNLIEKVMEKRLPDSAEIVIDIPEERYFSVRVSPLSYRVGVLAAIVAIFHDTTHIRKLEQMRRDFVANVSHEIKTPVTAIKGFSETLLDGAINDRQNAEKFLNTIKRQGERLNRLVEDLLTLSKIELRETRMNKRQINFSGVVDNVIQTMVIQAAEKNITIKKNMADTSIQVNADKDRLIQILLNLVDNAIKFTEKGEVEIGMAEDGEKHFFYVRDSGIGIPEKYMSRLGERFFRVDPSRSRELGGTGLGLAIVKHLIKAHGWEMRIESKFGKGTIVKVFYPNHDNK